MILSLATASPPNTWRRTPLSGALSSYGIRPTALFGGGDGFVTQSRLHVKHDIEGFLRPLCAALLQFVLALTPVVAREVVLLGIQDVFLGPMPSGLSVPTAQRANDASVEGVVSRGPPGDRFTGRVNAVLEGDCEDVQISHHLDQSRVARSPHQRQVKRGIESHAPLVNGIGEDLSFQTGL